MLNFAENHLRLSDQVVYWTLGALAIVTSPHIFYLPWWISLVLLVCLLWRIAFTLPNTINLPTGNLRSLFGLLGMAAIHRSYQTLFGAQAGIALLILLLGLKLLELKKRRDAIVVIFLGYFIIITVFLRSQSIFIAVYMIVAVIVLTGSLIAIQNTRKAYHPRDLLRPAVILFFQAAPIALILFLLFPRLDRPLWSMPDTGTTGISGLSDEMEPGSINQLTQSDAVAFRVTFEGQLPNMEQRYWRGPVFDATDGRRWWTSQRSKSTRAPHLELRANPVAYTITLEPHRQRWLFSLEMPDAAPKIGKITPDLQFIAPKPVTQRLRYRLVSYSDYRVTGLTPEARRRNLVLPKTPINPQARILGTELAANSANPRDLIRRIFAYLRREPFYYTFTPPLLGENPIDEFLFTTRRGYCEHYAAATTFLLRASGIPARVVTGYLGGEFNPLDNYLVVRQMDAHAWVEAWVEDDGWIRLDPTTALPAERVEGTPAFWSQSPSRIENLFGPTPGFAADLLRTLRRSWDAINHRWNQWVLGYDAQRRAEFLDYLGLRGWSEITLALLMAGVILLFLIIFTGQARRAIRHRDSLSRSWDFFCWRIARLGLPGRLTEEGILTYGERISRLRPDLARWIILITRLYSRLHYGPSAPTNWYRHFRRLTFYRFLDQTRRLPFP